MARGAAGKSTAIMPQSWVAALERAAVVAGGGVLVMAALALALALASYDSGDPSFNRATIAAPQNWLGHTGAYASDLLLQLAGLANLLLVPVLALLGVRLIQRRGIEGWRRQLAATLGAVLLTATALALPGRDFLSDLPAGAGGIAGLLLGRIPEAATGLLPPDVNPAAVTAPVGVLLGLAALALFFYALGISRENLAALRARLAERSSERADAPPSRPAPRAQPRRDAPRDAETVPETAAAPTKRIVTPEKKAAPSKREAREKQSRLDLRDSFQLPPLSLLTPPPKAAARKIDAASLEQNARLLESVLDDFGVKGEIVEVRPGPVVTMYELEPAAGIKASRVIGLADDIARSMSALSARIAVVPGRNVIGIELPNVKRETVSLSEMLSSDAFESQNAALPIVLGKDIAGDPVVADLAPMPHLLIAGTTGSGKSVGLNAMILSLLYRLSPRECKMIMIDPKMLELSVYDGIPHLLSPVVTEPPKAIRALKWAVEQMEDRYRMMASVNVRSLSGFNARVKEARAKGEPFVRRVHTGYDSETGQPIYETETLEFDTLPLIVVVVDELADLMMTAGKEVEFLIQRLAQKARAAGIHLIMATQRPSVDVITGVIKANLPTRISFSVTSKIDSRTILGEQGAEQLLGKGDMLYMPGGKQIARVHGPFVSDEEVERVAIHWREQGAPEYIAAVTEEPEGSDGQFGLPIDEDDAEAGLYRRAIQVVAESQKASTSYLQRQLRVGYNNAARLIERMEKDGYVGTPDHVGRREVLIDPDGNRI
ncbi:FtsK/SpoIIIE family DNA translocase [Sphingosinicella microcystinivorans]|uniref:FtsK/SpoIIIE family DNA translocase n=1 Tax=Sphingosinicella microcystinivorans TaxID=335406 RepID=UPI0022F3F152|nr:DNA translocase FtsK 4TM domain-containing protein [Sphingosinicella microcystinivorans]WBX85556.1 DNA translocase FtsK 4TM domain-containing protein [Sphingosinicella microcystinivorans]